MAFENTTNRKRVMKIIETIDLIEKSAKSNSASPSDLADMLAPIATQLRILGTIQQAGEEQHGASTAEPQERAPHRRGAAMPPWENIREMAEQAPLKDLSVALAVYMNRVDHELSKC